MDTVCADWIVALLYMQKHSEAERDPSFLRKLQEKAYMQVCHPSSCGSGYGVPERRGIDTRSCGAIELCVGGHDAGGSDHDTAAHQATQCGRVILPVELRTRCLFGFCKPRHRLAFSANVEAEGQSTLDWEVYYVRKAFKASESRRPSPLALSLLLPPLPRMSSVLQVYLFTV
jgi:hypothetical protein